jgi:hypothetical protein
MRELILDLFQQLHHMLLMLQYTYMSSPQRLERGYLILLLFIVLVVVTEKLRNPQRKLRNRSDRVAWGQR